MCDNMIYHYCGVETFLNIIRNHTLRLSDLCKSTDRLELKSLLDAVEEGVSEKLKKTQDFYGSIIYGINGKDAFSYMLQMIISQIVNDVDQMLFGVCFSEEGDLLEQWREYADRGSGLAIGFERNWFENLCKRDEMFKFAKIEYGYKEEKNTIVAKLSSSIYKQMIHAIADGESNKIFEGTYASCFPMVYDKKELYQESIFIKKEEYCNEKEWRLILNDEDTCKTYDDWCEYYNWSKSDGEGREGDIYDLIPNGMEFMVRNGKIVPYLDLKYDLDEDNTPIKEIIIGPNCKVDKLDIFHLLEFFGFDGNKINIRKSQSSYRL